MRTRVGYAGGATKNPNYNRIGDHTETFQLDFDPAVISYERLLEIFWQSHNPCADSGSRQYMSAVFYHDEEQKKLALKTRDREAVRRKQPVVTPILPVGTFYLGEDYHQKYYLRQTSKLMREFEAMYPNTKDWLASTATARVNGYLGGNGAADQLEKELPGLGLSEESQKLLRQLFKQRSQR